MSESANPVKEAYREVLDAIECDTEGEERCVLLKAAIHTLALASAKAMLPPRNRPGAKTGVERRYLALKAQLEALGR